MYFCCNPLSLKLKIEINKFLESEPCSVCCRALSHSHSIHIALSKMNSINVIGRRCTLVVIAHRLSTVKRSDMIYEFEDGRIKANGTFEELKEKSETFRGLTYFEESRIGNTK